MTQNATAQTLKKNTENQSTAAAVLRLSVGNAKAASSANAGSESIRARSCPPITTLAVAVTVAQLSGTAMWRLMMWRRHCQSVQSAMGHIGHKNQSHCRATAFTLSSVR